MFSRNLYCRKVFKNQVHEICRVFSSLMICSEPSKPVELSKDPIFLDFLIESLKIREGLYLVL